MYFFAEANIIELCLYISLYTKERMNYMAKSQAKKTQGETSSKNWI